METRTEEQKQTQPWNVGDLYQFPTGLVLCVGAGHTFAYFISEQGMPLGDVQMLDLPDNVQKLHNTGLCYEFQSRDQLLRDFQAGLFTPYFEIL